MHTSLVRLRAWLLNPDPNRLPHPIDVEVAERLLGCDRGRLIKDPCDLLMQATDSTSPLYQWAHTGHLCSGRISQWVRKYNR